MGDDGGIVGGIILLGIGVGAFYLWKKGKLSGILDLIKQPASGTGGTGVGTPIGGGTKPKTGGGGVPTSIGGAIKFAAAGDWGSGRNSNWKATVANMKRLGPSVVLLPGDFSYKTPSEFVSVTSAIKQFAKIIGARGNHDTNGNYGSQFNAYSNSVVTIGDTSFMSLDTESASASIAFAKANLSRMPGRWKVVQFHKPIFTSAGGHLADEGGIKSLVPEFAKAKIHLVIAGHAHNYQRHAPKSGVTYVVVGTAGESFHKLSGKGAGVVKQTDNQFGCLFCTTGSSMSCKFVTNSGGVFDSWTISPTRSAYTNTDTVMSSYTYGLGRNMPLIGLYRPMSRQTHVIPTLPMTIN